MNQTSSKSYPFVATSWITEFLPFDPFSNSTFCEIPKGEQLYALIGDYIVKQIHKSYRFTPKKNVSKATRILEKLARNAKYNKDKNKNGVDDETKVCTNHIDEEKEEEKEEEKSVVSLGLGLHEFIWDDTKLYAIHQTIGCPVSPPAWGGCGNPPIFTSLLIFVEGEAKLKFLRKFIDFIIDSDSTKKGDSLFFRIYRWNMKSKYWRKSGKKIARDVSTIILPTETWNKLILDFERFIDEKSIAWYFQHGIPYKRSYLFYGVPGSGKSSLIQALAAKYDKNLCFLQPTDEKMTDEAFKDCIQSAPSSSLIVLEDIDALFNKDRTTKECKCPLTFSGLLNGLDGVGNPDGQIFVMTTNFVDKLDSALIRSGRVDLHIEFPLATDEQITKMFLLFYPKETDLSNKFVQAIRANFSDGLSMAAIQQHFIQHMHAQPQIVVDTVKLLGDRLDVVTAFDKEKKEEDDEKSTEEHKAKDKETKVEKETDKLYSILLLTAFIVLIAVFFGNVCVQNF